MALSNYAGFFAAKPEQVIRYSPLCSWRVSHPYQPKLRQEGDRRAIRHRPRQTRLSAGALNPPVVTCVLRAGDWRPRRTTSCRKCNRTRCRRKSAIGWRPRSPGRWRARGARATTSPSSSRWRTPSGPAYSWTACTAGWSPRR